MPLKDYYKTLNISPTATLHQIKKSFRMLAMQLHPDRNPGSAYAEARFREVREAYETLSDTKRRAEYNYKRWYTKSLGKQFKTEPTTPSAILAEFERLVNYLDSSNVFQVDYDGLSYHIRKILSDTNIGILHQFDEIGINRQVVQKTLRCCISLPLDYTVPITALLIRVAGNDKDMKENIDLFAKQQRQTNQWHKYKAFTIIIVTLLICWLIYMLSR
jgi:molecular chaperone DnaJ